MGVKLKVKKCKCGRTIRNTKSSKCSYCLKNLRKEKNLKNKVKKQSLPTYQSKTCLDLWKAIVKRKGMCEVCGKKGNGLNAHHIIGEKNLTLKFDVINGVALCPGHHKLFRESAHEDWIWFMFWLMTNRPDDYNYLFTKREEEIKKVDYGNILKKLKKFKM